MRWSGVWVLAALIAGLGAGYWIGSQQEPVPAERPPPVGTGGAGTPSAHEQSKTDLLRSEAAPPAPKPVPTSPPTLATSAAGGKIRGRVVDQAGAPIADVLVTAVPLGPGSTQRPTPGGGAPVKKPLQERLEDAEKRVRFLHAGRREAHTDAAGRYQVDGLGAGQYRVQAYREGFLLRAGRRSNAWRAEAGDVVDFAGEAVVLVYVDVVDPSGQAPKSVTLRTSTDEEGRKGRKAFGWSPERNWISVQPGTHWLTASAGQDQDLKASKQQFTAVTGAQAPRLTVRLEGRPGIRGQLTFAEPLTATRLQLKALMFMGETPPDAAAVLQSRQSERVRYDSRDGTYSVKDLEPGRYLLVASYDGQRVDLTRVVEVRDTMVELDLELPPVDRGYYRIVRVIGEDGEPVAGVNFSVKITGPRMSAAGPASFLRREDGSYYVSLRLDTGRRSLPASGSDDVARLSVSTRDRGSVDRVVDPKGTDEILIRWGDPATVDLTIAGFTESGLTGNAHIYMKATLEEDGIGFSGQGVPVTSEGRVHIPNQQAGERVAVLVYRGEGGTTQVKAFRLRLTGGENHPTVRLPRLHDVRVEGAASSVQLKCLDAAGPYIHQFGRPEEDGNFVLHFVPPGRYEASCYVGEGKTKKVHIDVPAQTVIRLN